MRVLIRHDSTTAAVAANIQTVEAWKTDTHSPAELGLSYSKYGVRQTGFVPGWLALVILVKVTDKTLNPSLVRRGIPCPTHDWADAQHEIVQSHASHPESFGGWMTQEGDLTIVGGFYEYRNGTRGGLRQAQPCRGVYSTPSGEVVAGTYWHYFRTRHRSLSPDDMEPARAVHNA